MHYGKMEEKTHETHGQYFAGEVSSEGYTGRFYAVPNLRRDKDTAPDFLIRQPHRPGEPFRELGAIWEKAQRGTGEVFYTLTFDGPNYTKPCNLAAFKDENEPHYNLIFKRKRGGKSSQATGQDSTGEGADVPFG